MSMEEEAMLNLRWDLFSSQLATTLDTCYEKQYFVDLSLVCKDGTTIKCHKMVLANSSTFFRRILVKNDHPHPMIVLHDIEADDLKTIVNFMYCGEIEVVKSEVRRLLKIAEILEISGLKDIRSSTQFQNTYATQLASFPPEKKVPENVDSSPSSSCKSYYFEQKCPEIFKNANDTENRFDQIMNPEQTSTSVSLHQNYSTSESNYRTSSKENFKETPAVEKTQKRTSDENCQYLKKLRLLGEIDIICNLNSPPHCPPKDLRLSVNDKADNYDNIVKSENDPVDAENFDTIGNLNKIIQKKIFSNPGIEIFKAKPKRLSESTTGPNRGESLSPRSGNSVDSF